MPQRRVAVTAAVTARQALSLPQSSSRERRNLLQLSAGGLYESVAGASTLGMHGERPNTPPLPPEAANEILRQASSTAS